MPTPSRARFFGNAKGSCLVPFPEFIELLLRPLCTAENHAPRTIKRTEISARAAKLEGVARLLSFLIVVPTISPAPAGQDKRGLLVAPQLFQRWGSDQPNHKPRIIRLDRASGPLFITLRELYACWRLH
jgi:hypothetical protein